MNASKFWLVWNPYGRAPSVKHPTSKSANDEAKRLASVAPGSEFIVLESCGSYCKTDVAYTPHKLEVAF